MDKLYLGHLYLCYVGNTEDDLKFVVAYKKGDNFYSACNDSLVDGKLLGFVFVDRYERYRQSFPETEYRLRREIELNNKLLNIRLTSEVEIDGKKCKDFLDAENIKGEYVPECISNSLCSLSRHYIKLNKEYSVSRKELIGIPLLQEDISVIEEITNEYLNANKIQIEM